MWRARCAGEVSMGRRFASRNERQYRRGFSVATASTKAFSAVSSCDWDVKSEFMNAYREGPTLPPEHFDMELTFPTTEIPDLTVLIPGIERINGRTVQYSAKDYKEVFNVFHLIMMLKKFCM